MEIEGPFGILAVGPGQTTKYIQNLGIEISGLDLSEKVLKQVRMIHPGIHFQKRDILDLEFDNNSITGVVAFYAIDHLTKEQAVLAFSELFRVLKPDGIVLCTYHIYEETIHLDEFLGKKVDIDFMFFNTDFILSCLKDIGFKKIEAIEREPYTEVKYESRRAHIFAKNQLPILYIVLIGHWFGREEPRCTVQTVYLHPYGNKK